MTTIGTMVTLQVWRLENTSGEHYKQYTVFANDQYVFFGFSRIGSAWQWQVPATGDPTGKAISQMRSKRRGGYEEVWHADLTIPRAWAENVKQYARQIQDFTEGLFREDKPSGTAGTPAAEQATSALAPVLDRARSVVSKMAVDPDSALKEYAGLLADVEAATEDLNTVTSYMETLQIMLTGAGAGAA